MPLLKIKSKARKESKPRVTYAVDLSKFEKLSDSSKKTQLALKAFGTGDRQARNDTEMNSDEEEKNNIDN